MKKFLLLLCMALCSAALYAGEPSATALNLPGNSIYQLPVTLENQDGKIFDLTHLRGKNVLISMFYNSCEYVCPMLIDTLRLTEKKLTVSEQKKLAIVLVSFDPARDSVEVLQHIAATRELDTRHWNVTRTDDSSVRQLAAALNIQYRKMQNGEFNHTSVIILLDTEGRILARSGQMGTVDTQFLQKIKAATYTR
jgi:protein SCO1/2